MICHNSEMKKQSGFEVLKAGTQTVGKDYPRPGFLMGTAIKCYAVGTKKALIYGAFSA